MTPIDELRKVLTDAGIPFENRIERWKDPIVHAMFRPLCRGEADKYQLNQVIYGRYGEADWKLDAVWHYGTYGRYEGLLELWGDMIEGDPITATVEETFQMIKADWEKERDGE